MPCGYIFRFPLGLRMVEELLAARGIIVSIQHRNFPRRGFIRAHQLADLMPISLRRGASPPLDTSNEPVKRPESEGETAKS